MRGGDVPYCRKHNLYRIQYMQNTEYSTLHTEYSTEYRSTNTEFTLCVSCCVKCCSPRPNLPVFTTTGRSRWKHSLGRRT